MKRRNKERSQEDKGSAKEKKKKRSRGFGDDEPKISRFKAVASEVRPRSAHLLVLTCVMRVHCREVIPQEKADGAAVVGSSMAW